MKITRVHLKNFSFTKISLLLFFWLNIIEYRNFVFHCQPKNSKKRVRCNNPAKQINPHDEIMKAELLEEIDDIKLLLLKLQSELLVEIIGWRNTNKKTVLAWFVLGNQQSERIFSKTVHPIHHLILYILRKPEKKSRLYKISHTF